MKREKRKEQYLYVQCDWSVLSHLGTRSNDVSVSCSSTTILRLRFFLSILTIQSSNQITASLRVEMRRGITESTAIISTLRLDRSSDMAVEEENRELGQEKLLRSGLARKWTQTVLSETISVVRHYHIRTVLRHFLRGANCSSRALPQLIWEYITRPPHQDSKPINTNFSGGTYHLSLR